jgi:TatD DNase family protein
MQLFDTHAHLDDPQFEDDLEDVLARAGPAGVGRIVCVGTSLRSSRRSVELAARFGGRLFAAVGIHPNYWAEAGADDFDAVCRLAERPEVVAVGETGLDFHRRHTRPAAQRDAFRRHIGLAREVTKPLIVHVRRAHQPALEILRPEAEGLSGVRHCFDGTPGEAAAYLELGFYLSFAAQLTRAGYGMLKHAAREAPEDRILVETDSPYLIPEGRRGRRNEPAFLPDTVAALARLRGLAPEEVALLTTRNAEGLFLEGSRER